MERIIIRHLSGSRVNQVEEFPVKHLKELSIGRDPFATIKFDPDKDDMVSRLHAKITQDEQDETKFILTDLGSRNRTYINKVPVEGSVLLTVGDVIQLGPKGPEFEFDLDPRPVGAPKTTRIYTPTLAPTREEEAASVTAGGSSSEQPRSVGPRTLEFIVGRVKGDTRRSLINTSAALLGLLILIAGILWYFNSQKIGETRQQIAEVKDVTVQTQEEAKGVKEELNKHSAVKSPEEIVKQYGPATVFIQASWKLVNIKDGNHACHVHFNAPIYKRNKDGNRIKNKKGEYIVERMELVPFYLRISGSSGSDSVEPLLFTKLSSSCRDQDKIGGILTGTGFVIKPQGFILTNRHVAATWRTSYEIASQAQSSSEPLTPASQQQPSTKFSRGRICDSNDIDLEVLRKLEVSFVNQKVFDEVEKIFLDVCKSTTPEDLKKVGKWVPAQTKQFGVNFDGVHEYLEVIFPNTNTKLKAHLVNISEVADVALIKVDAAESLKEVDLIDSTEDTSVRAGSPVIVLGYPEVSPNVIIARLSQDPNNPEPTVKNLRSPTVTNGIIGKVTTTSSDSPQFYSPFGQIYQLNINTTGAGNSGGPVFNTDGKVIGIYSLRWEAGGASVSGAIPIKYGRELIEIKPAL